MCDGQARGVCRLCPQGPTHVHAIAEGRVGSVLEAALVADVIQDSGRHRWGVHSICGGSVIQAHTPAAAAQMGQEGGVTTTCPRGKGAA